MLDEKEFGIERAIRFGLVFSIPIWILIVGAIALAQPNPGTEEARRAGPRKIGYDFLGAAQPNFNYKAAARFLPQGTPLGFLDFTFGPDLEPMRYLIRTINPTDVRVHFFNGPGVRNGVIGQYDPSYQMTINQFDFALGHDNQKLFEFYRRRVILWKRLAAEFPNTRFIISPVLEHNLSAASWRNIAEFTREVWPGVQLNNNAMNCQGEKYLGAWVECHGQKPVLGSADINSLDGDEASDIDIKAWLDRTYANRITYVWGRGYNCRTQGFFLDPRKRIACPTPALFEELAHITDTPPTKPLPKFSCEFQSFSAPAIWKPLAEDKGIGDQRANLPVAILAAKPTTLNIVGAGGTSVGALAYYGAFQNGQNRYYSGSPGGSKINGYAFQKEALRTQGSPWVWIKQGGKCWGPFIPGRRAGDFR